MSLTFSVSDLTLLQSWFLREGNIVFFSDNSFNGIYISFLGQCLRLCVCDE